METITASQETNRISSLGTNGAEQTVVNAVFHKILENLLGRAKKNSREQPTQQRETPNMDAASPLQLNELLEGDSQVIETKTQTEIGDISHGTHAPLIERRMSSLHAQTLPVAEVRRFRRTLMLLRALW